MNEHTMSRCVVVQQWAMPKPIQEFLRVRCIEDGLEGVAGFGLAHAGNQRE